MTRFSWKPGDIEIIPETGLKSIREEEGHFVIYSSDGSKKLGTYRTRAEAIKRLAQIEYFKHQEKEIDDAFDVLFGSAD